MKRSAPRIRWLVAFLATLASGTFVIDSNFATAHAATTPIINDAKAIKIQRQLLNMRSSLTRDRGGATAASARDRIGDVSLVRSPAAMSDPPRSGSPCAPEGYCRDTRGTPKQDQSEPAELQSRARCRVRCWAKARANHSAWRPLTTRSRRPLARPDARFGGLLRGLQRLARASVNMH